MDAALRLGTGASGDLQGCRHPEEVSLGVVDAVVAQEGKRRVVFGLCAEHSRRRRLFRKITFLSLPTGVALVIAGIFGKFTDSMELLAIGPGIALVVTGLIIAVCGSDPRLAGESAHFLWVKGAGKPFLDRQVVRGA